MLCLANNQLIGFLKKVSFGTISGILFPQIDTKLVYGWLGSASETVVKSKMKYTYLRFLQLRIYRMVCRPSLLIRLLHVFYRLNVFFKFSWLSSVNIRLKVPISHCMQTYINRLQILFSHINVCRPPSLSSFFCLFIYRLYGFKIHPMAYQMQQQAAANFKAPMRAMAYNNGKRWSFRYKYFVIVRFTIFCTLYFPLKIYLISSLAYIVFCSLNKCNI